MARRDRRRRRGGHRNPIRDRDELQLGLAVAAASAAETAGERLGT
jgi:hypothetical protein